MQKLQKVSIFAKICIFFAFFWQKILQIKKKVVILQRQMKTTPKFSPAKLLKFSGSAIKK